MVLVTLFCGSASSENAGIEIRYTDSSDTEITDMESSGTDDRRLEGAKAVIEK